MAFPSKPKLFQVVIEDANKMSIEKDKHLWIVMEYIKRGGTFYIRNHKIMDTYYSHFQQNM